jgi:hypothetical protein
MYPYEKATKFTKRAFYYEKEAGNYIEQKELDITRCIANDVPDLGANLLVFHRMTYLSETLNFTYCEDMLK